MLGINPLEIGTGLSYINKIKLFSVPFVANIINRHRPFYNYHLFSRGVWIVFQATLSMFLFRKDGLRLQGNNRLVVRHVMLVFEIRISTPNGDNRISFVGFP